MDDTSGVDTNGRRILLNSGSGVVVDPSKYVVLHDFMVLGSTPYVELMALNFTVDVDVNATFYIINSTDDSIFPKGVSY